MSSFKRKENSLYLSTYYSRTTNATEADCFKVVILNRSLLQAKVINKYI
jgi:hypothetical protein